jgi:histidine triad (HIT) family protein
MPANSRAPDPGCLFCRIVAGELPSQRVYEDDAVIVIRDLHPRAPTHVLAMPRAHIRSAHELTDADAPLLSALFSALREVADAQGLANGYRIVSNIGPAGGQTVDHLHFHLLGGRGMQWPPG